MSHWFALVAACSGFVSVALGAFGVHALKAKLSPEMLTVFETGIRYQMFHTLALLTVSALLQQGDKTAFRASGWFFIAGILLFTGSLILLSLTGMRKWGAVTPLGGLAFLLGWAFLAWGIFSRQGG